MKNLFSVLVFTCFCLCMYNHAFATVGDRRCSVKVDSWEDEDTGCTWSNIAANGNCTGYYQFKKTYFKCGDDGYWDYCSMGTAQSGYKLPRKATDVDEITVISTFFCNLSYSCLYEVSLAAADCYFAYLMYQTGSCIYAIDAIQLASCISLVVGAVSCVGDIPCSENYVTCDPDFEHEGWPLFGSVECCLWDSPLLDVDDKVCDKPNF